jgi:Flp pilus assembly protein TadB
VIEYERKREKMKKEEWTAVIDAFALVVSLIAAYIFDAELADLIVAVVVAAQPIVLIFVVKMYGERKTEEISGAVDRAMDRAVRDLRRD